MTFSQRGRRRINDKKNSLAFWPASIGCMWGYKVTVVSIALPLPISSSAAGQFLPGIVPLILMSSLFSNGSHPEAEVSSFCEVSRGTVTTELEQ